MDINKHKAKYFVIAVLLTLIILVSSLLIAYNQWFFGEQPLEFPVKGNINPPFNQAIILVQYKGEWVGSYSFNDSESGRQGYGFGQITGERQVTANRTQNASPWILDIVIQSFDKIDSNLTLSVFLLNGTLISRLSSSSERDAPLFHLYVNMDNLTSRYFSIGGSGGLYHFNSDPYNVG